MKKLLLVVLLVQTNAFAQTMRITDPGHEIEFTAPDKDTVIVNGETLTFSYYKATSNWNERHYRGEGGSTASFYIKTIHHVGPRRTYAVFNLKSGKYVRGFMKID